MNSPAVLSFPSFINLDRTSSTTIYLQIAQQMINAIQRGYLLIGTKLPGTRILSSQLQVHRKTIIAAYLELEEQGWLLCIPNKGTYIVDQQVIAKLERPYQNLISLGKYPAKTGFELNQSHILDSPFESKICDYKFTDGTPDIRLTSLKDLSSMFSASMNRKNTRSKLEYDTTEKNGYFKTQLCNYLNLTRGLHISKNNLLITRSTEMSLYIISQLLLSSGDTVLVAELGYFGANMVFQKAGAAIKTIPIDKEGICVSFIREFCAHNKVRMVYITPHHHYPTTVTLSASRRIELLQLADIYGFIIIEDDYDFEFQYEQLATMPLASADVNGMVIYLGTFGKSLAPGFRTGFVVAPENLMHEMQKYLAIIDRQDNVITEMVLGEMIEEGTIYRHLKKSLKEYQARRNTFSELLNHYFSHDVVFEKPTGGLALWADWNPELSLYAIAKKCAKNGLLIPQILLYQNKKQAAMRLGFGHMDFDEMEQGLLILKKSIETLKSFRN